MAFKTLLICLILIIAPGCRFQAITVSHGLTTSSSELNSPPDAPPPQTFDIQLVINMKHAGAKGDGISDDSSIIQGTIDNAPENTQFYFPPGTYRIANLEIANRANLELIGDGNSSVIQWSGAGLPASYSPMMTFTNVEGLAIRNLNFDNRSIPTYGGIRFYSVKNVTIEHTHFYDSNRNPTLTTDRYAYVFGQGEQPSEDVWMTDNTIEDLEAEIDHGRRFHVLRNTFHRGIWLCLNWSSHGPNSILEDYEIVGNTFTEPAGYAMTFHSEHDGPHRIHGLRIADNTIFMSSYKRWGINIGNTQNMEDSGSVWENITIENNRIEYAPGYTFDASAINLFRSSGDGAFTNVTIRGNTILAGQTLNYPALALTALQNSTVSGNSITGATYGISLVNDTSATTLSQNSVEATQVAYRFENSLGNNKIFDNLVLGTPRTPWVVSGERPSDQIAR